MLEYFLDPYPDELLYSVWARFSAHVQYPNREDVTQELFGSRSYHALIDWSCSLNYLVSQLPADHCYTVDMLIDNHTLFPLYAPFLVPERRHLLRNQMITGNGTALSARMGILTSHIPHHKWLRYCPECAKNDRDRFGETYWHRLHQVPGVEVCPIHTTFLENSNVIRQPKKGVFITAEGAISSIHSRLAIYSPLWSLLMDITVCVDQLLHGNYASPGMLFFKKQYIALLERHSFITIKKSLRVAEFLKALTDYYPSSFLSLIHCELSQTRHIEAEWPARLPLARKPQHPLHHILVIRFLGATIESFFNSSFHPPRPFGNGPWPCLNPICKQHRTLCIASYSTREKSLKGCPVGLFACPCCGFTYSRVGPDRSPDDIFRRDRIPTYGHLWQIKLRELWPDPDISTEYIARRLGVDFNTITWQARKLGLPLRRVLQKRRVPNQHERKEPEQQRTEWLRLVAQHSQGGITVLLRRIKGARSIYNWLNKHDQEWLHSHLPPKKVPQRTKVHMHTTFRPVNKILDQNRRAERDATTSQAIRLKAQQIVNAPGEPRRVTRAQLEKVAPSVGWLLSRSNNFPLTAQAFREVKETREIFALRRVQWTLQKCQEERIKPTRREFILRAKVGKALDIPVVQEAIEKALIELSGTGCYDA